MLGTPTQSMHQGSHAFNDKKFQPQTTDRMETEPP